jgi:uncharacterized membrane protein
VTVTYDIVWKNKRPVLKAIHINNPQIDTLSRDIRSLSSKQIKDELLRLELAQVEFEGMNEVARVAIVSNPQSDPASAIANKCKISIQSARNRLMSLRKELS